MVELVREKIQKESIDQYKIEERSIIVRRMISYHDRIGELLDCMEEDTISIDKNIELLKQQIYNYTLDVEFRKSTNMGQVLRNALSFVKRNYDGINMDGFA